MAVKDEYLRNVKPQLENDGVALDRQPILNIGSGLTIVSEPGTLRNTLSVDSGSFGQITQFTGSIGGITFFNQVTPRFALAGSVTSGSPAVLSCSLRENTHFQPFVRAIIRGVGGATLLLHGKTVVCSLVSGSDPVIDVDSDSTDNIGSFATITAAVDTATDALIFTLTSTTSSNFNFTLFADGPLVDF